MVTLLLVHIQLHGLQQPERAAISYKRVLQDDVEATIAALAEQGLQRCRAEDIPSGACNTPATNGAIPLLFKDPFLTTDPDRAKPATADVVTAMTWLFSDEEPRSMPTPDPSSTPATVTSPEPTLTPEANSKVELANQEPGRSEEEPPLDTIEPTPQPQEPAATKLLEYSWLRVQLQPAKSPIYSVEPMGLINRIKGVVARSAGR